MASVYHLLFPLAFFTVVFAAVDKNEKTNKNYTITEKVYFDIEIKDPSGIEDDINGRLEIGLFGNVCPMTVLNFVSLVRGFKKGGTQKLSYKNCKVHRIVRDFVVQLGDITVGDGSGGVSIYGDKFVDENFILSHRATGFVSMANHGKDTNGSQFFILLNKARWLDGKHVVFGKVIKGMKFLKELGETPSNSDNAVPKRSVKVTDCGMLKMLKDKPELTEKQIDTDTDILDI